MTGEQWSTSLRRVKKQFPTRFFPAFVAPLLVVSVHLLTVRPGESGTRTKPVSSAVPISLDSPESVPPKGGTVKRGQTSFVLLRQAGVSAAEVIKVQQAVQPVYDLRHVQEGQPYSVTVAANGSLQHFVYEIDMQQRLEVKRQGQTFVGRLESIVYDHKRRVLQGTIHGSLYEALAGRGESLQIAADMAEIFAWDIDFHTDLRDGDTFRVLVEERYRDGKFVGYQRILAAELGNQQRVFQAVYYAAPEAQSPYYRPDGTSIRRMFLRSPLQYTRISSQFSQHRLHPVLGQYRPHLGIDYAAPTGTPVRSVADGVIAWASMKGASGNMVEVRHNSVYSTFYLHLSRFASDLHVGNRVAQGEVIGYVGSTGLATGPHLDFRLTKAGKYLNPLEHKSIEAPPLPREVLPAFRTHAKRLLAELTGPPRRE